MIGKLQCVVLDCPDVRELARFLPVAPRRRGQPARSPAGSQRRLLDPSHGLWPGICADEEGLDHRFRPAMSHAASDVSRGNSLTAARLANIGQCASAPPATGQVTPGALDKPELVVLPLLLGTGDAADAATQSLT